MLSITMPAAAVAATARALLLMARGREGAAARAWFSAARLALGVQAALWHFDWPAAVVLAGAAALAGTAVPRRRGKRRGRRSGVVPAPRSRR